MGAQRIPWNVITNEFPKVDGPTIKVRVREGMMGEYEYVRRREGDVFTLKPRMVTVCHHSGPRIGEPVMEGNAAKQRLLTAEEQFSERWMERVDDDEPERITPAQAALNRAQEEINEGRRPAPTRRRE